MGACCNVNDDEVFADALGISPLVRMFLTFLGKVLWTRVGMKVD